MPSRTNLELLGDSVDHGKGYTSACTMGQESDTLQAGSQIPGKAVAIEGKSTDGHWDPESIGKRWASEESVAEAMLKPDGTIRSVSHNLSIDSLPEELLLMIFSYINLSENVNILQNVCTRWRELARDATLWSDLKYVIREDTSDEEAIRTFNSAPQLRTVIMDKTAQPCVFEALYKNCHNLTTLDTFYQQTLSYEVAMALFHGCNKIKVLRISERDLRTDERFTEALAQLHQLQVLLLKQYHDEGVPVRLGILAGECPLLCEVDLGQLPYQLRDMEAFLAAGKRPLKHLGINWSSVERRCVVPVLALCANSLQHLQLYTFNMTSEEAARAFSALGQLQNLKELILETVDGRLQPGLQEQLPRLIPLAFQSGCLSKLQLLCLWRIWDLGDEALSAVSEGCPELRELSLEACWGHTDAAFQQLHLLKKLEIFTLSSCSCLGGDAMRHIAQLPAVQTLCLSYVNFQKLWPGVESLLTMTELRSLYLHESNCWSLPFSKFPGRLFNLGTLHIDYCNGDQSELDRMCAEMPELFVEGKLEDLFSDSDNNNDDY